MPHALRLENVVKRYGSVPVLGPISLDVARGEMLTLLGPSGCGKSTTLNIIAGLTLPSEGRVMLGDRDISRVAPPYRDIGMVFQNYALFPHRTVAENVAFGLRMRKVPKAEIAPRVRRMLDLVGLPGVEDRLPRALSGGQRQRVAVARAIVIEPSILLLDEPLSNLDALLRKRMRLELREIQQRLGITTVFVTHDQDEAFEMSDRVVLMQGGQIQQIGAPEELYDRPKSRFAATFIGEASLIPAKITGGSGRLSVAEIEPGLVVEAEAVAPLTQGQSAVVMMRPERVEIGAEGAPGIPVTIAKRIFQGERVLLVLRTAGGSEIQASLPSTEANRALAPGQRVTARPLECRILPEDGHAA